MHAGNLTTRQIFGRGNVQTYEISNVLGNVTTCDIYGIQVYSRFDIVNSTVTFPVHFHADFWSGNVTFFPVLFCFHVICSIIFAICLHVFCFVFVSMYLFSIHVFSFVLVR